MSVGMDKREERPAYVRFQRRPIKDAAASEREGKYMAKDVDYALVTPPYSRDVFEQVATEWLAQMEKEVRNNRLPREWYERYEAAYERWKKGEELPLNGTPIKGWAVLSPEEGRRRIGMGAQDLCDKAKAWLSQAKDKGPLTMENSTLKAENQALKTQNKTLEARVKELAERVEIMQRGGLLKEHFYSEPTPARDAIEVSDIIEKVEAQKRPTLTARK
jgi:hypothetical protein